MKKAVLMSSGMLPSILLATLLSQPTFLPAQGNPFASSADDDPFADSSSGAPAANPFAANPFGDPFSSGQSTPAAAPTATPAPAPSPGTERSRQVEAQLEKLRVLAGQDNYEQVYIEANRLLQIDPGNVNAIWWRDSAQRRLAARGTRDRQQQPILQATPTPTPYVPPEPLPLAPLSSSVSGSSFAIGGGLLAYILIGVSGIVLIALIYLFVARRRRQEEEPAPVPAVVPARKKAAAAAAPVFDLPTAPDLREEEEQQEEEEVSFEREDTLVLPKNRKKEEPKRQAAKVEEEPDPIDQLFVDGFHSEDEVAVEEQKVVEPEEHKSPIGIDYSNVDDIQVAPPPSTPPPQRAAKLSDPTAAHLQEAIFGHHEQEETHLDSPESLASPKKSDSGIDISKPAPVAARSAETLPLPEQSEESEADLTFNSLMFGAGASPAVPSTGDKKEPAAPAAESNDDLTMNSFDKEFQNVMFGAGAEKTHMPGQTAVPPAAAVNAPKPAAASAGKMSMFDRQKDAGKRALDNEDYARAVQCFSVALSLKPSDKEVRDLLEEARKKRRG